MGPYSIYEYLTFILPGASMLFVSFFGWLGWHWKEPGGTALVGIIAASFIAGNALSAFATWLEPLLLGGRPGSIPNGLWGQFAPGDRYAGRRDELLLVLRERYGEVSLEDGYALARTEVRASAEGGGLEKLNQQIGFYRGMTVAAVVGLLIEVAFAAGWHTHLPPGLWIPVLGASVVLFSYRYRRFWRWYGDYVLRVVRLLPPRNEVASGT